MKERNGSWTTWAPRRAPDASLRRRIERIVDELGIVRPPQAVAPVAHAQHDVA